MTTKRQKPLKLNNIIEVLNEGGFAAADCEHLGLYLGVDSSEISVIQSNKVGNVKAQLNAVINYWLKNEENPTWVKLAIALRNCGYRNLSNTISGKEQPSGIGCNKIYVAAAVVVVVGIVLVLVSRNTTRVVDTPPVTKATPSTEKMRDAPKATPSIETKRDAPKATPSTEKPEKEDPLDLMNIIEILNEGDFSAADCEQLGIMLGVKHSEIRTIQHNNPRDVRAQLNDIISSWLKNEKNPTREKLATALTKCGYKVLASTLCNKEKLSDDSPEDEESPKKKPKLEKELPTLEELKQQAYQARGSSGSVAIQGRTLHYKIKSGFYKWELVYKGEAWDEETGIRQKSGNKQSEDGARRHALANLLTELYNKKLFK